MIRNRFPSLVAMLAVAVLSGCATTSRAPEDSDPVTTAEGSGYLKEGPVVKLDAEPPQNTTLQQLEQRIREVSDLRARIDEAEQARSDAERRARESETSSVHLSARVSELERLLAAQGEDHRAVMDELIKTRLAKLRLERQMLQSHLAGLAAEEK
jgi:TolA-binding protein